MLSVYVLASIIGAAFLAKAITIGQLEIKKTPLDIPLALFLLSQIISTIFSIDPHTSIYGYYSRFHGGLLSAVSYLLLYYVFIAEYKNDLPFVKNLLHVSLGTGFLVAFYALLEKTGIDKNIWVQDVQNRVFSTLGQPNWLAAYISILIILSLSLAYGAKLFKKSLFFLLAFIFYLVIIFTKSRSGFAGFWGGLAIFAILIKPKEFYILGSIFLYLFAYLSHFRNLNLLPSFGNTLDVILVAASLINLPINIFLLIKKHTSGKIKIKKIFSYQFKIVLLSISIFLLSSFFFGTTFSQLEVFTFNGIVSKFKPASAPSAIPPTTNVGSLIEFGGTESGQIRKIVWKGGLNILKHYPLFGSGVETYAFSYYQFRPLEHNNTSEWDFLYNRAHNEYVNFAATTGIFGLLSYLSVIIAFLIFALKDLLKNNTDRYIISGFIGSYFTILISNFFGFSVVVVAVFFFMIPAFAFVYSKNKEKYSHIDINLSSSQKYLTTAREILIALPLAFSLYIIFSIVQMWRADKAYNLGHQLFKQNQYVQAYQPFKEALNLNPNEPLFKEELSLDAGTISMLASGQKQLQIAQQMKDEAINLSDQSVKDAPNNVNYWKTRTRLLYLLSNNGSDEALLKEAFNAISKAWQLSPNDSKIVYNVGLIYAKLGQTDKAIATLQRSVELKNSYYEPHFALALFYEELGEKEKAIEELKFIIEKIRPDDPQANEKLNALMKK